MRLIFGGWHITSFQVIILSFATVILVGAMLLTLPLAAAGPVGASFMDALFTATSATCVTGLVLHDTATYWSPFGQLIIMILIQIGGMGVVTVAVSIAMISGRKIGLMQRSTMQEAIAAPKVGGIVKLTGFIIRTVIVIELLGAAALSTVFCRRFGFFKGLWYGLFHSVSAFCNAGFDLMGAERPFSSLTDYSADAVVNLTVITLIIIGGLGFFTLHDIKQSKWRVRQYKMQTKVVLSVTGILIVLPAIYFFTCEFGHMPMENRVWSAIFQAVTPRTAGFNTCDLTAISETGLMLTIIMMMVGGSPGSTAGGMKTTTLAVLLGSAVSVCRRKQDAHFFGRRLPDGAVRDAATVMLLYLTLFLFAGMAIGRIDGIPMITALFEAASAIGTVGLSLGVTPSLCRASQLILIGLMFFGRVGGLTLIFAAIPGRNGNLSKYPQERITVG